MDNWEALPKRRKKSAATKNPARSNEELVEAAVQTRIDAARAVSTLESQDGCANLDHPADVQCHAWGKNLKAAFENMAPCMFNYMTDLSTIEINDKQTISFSVQAHDMQSLLYEYMNELLVNFCTDGFCCKRVEISELDRSNFRVVGKGYGDIFDPKKNTQGTEVKAITYSNMQIHETENRADLYVVVDI